MSIKILLAEDQSLLSSALAQLLDLEDDLTVCETVGDGVAALTAVRTQPLDVAILDIEMPGMTGLAVAEQIKALNLPLKVIILTTFANQHYFQTAVAAEVNGYLLKDIPSDELVADIHAVMAGRTIYSPELVASILDVVPNPLTEREMAILQAIQTGATTKEIAATQYLTNGTVRNYISAILSKLGADNRIEALNIAQQRNWL